MGKHKWTREEIIRRILDLDAKGVSLNGRQAGCQFGPLPGGFPHFWIVAKCPPGRRSFAGPGSRAERWTPAKILMVIRNLSQRRRPLRKKELEERFGNLVSAARRFSDRGRRRFASGVDPAKLRRVVP